jgi:hypothetical protein
VFRQNLSKSKLYWFVGQSVLVSGTHLGSATISSHSRFFYMFWFIDVEHPLWREVGSVIFSFCRASPAQPFSDLSPTGLMSIVYCLYFWDSPNLEGQVPVFISPRSWVAQLYPRPLGKTWQFLQTCIIMLKNKYIFKVFYGWIHVVSPFSMVVIDVVWIANRSYWTIITLNYSSL